MIHQQKHNIVCNTVTLQLNINNTYTVSSRSPYINRSQTTQHTFILRHLVTLRFLSLCTDDRDSAGCQRAYIIPYYSYLLCDFHPCYLYVLFNSRFKFRTEDLSLSVYYNHVSLFSSILPTFNFM
jgi:hypothetical protein